MSKVNERIFRSIVVAGAMLGTPLAAAADGKTGVTDAQPSMELVQLNAKIYYTESEVADAKTAADRDAAKAKLAKLMEQKKALEAKIAADKAAKPAEPKGAKTSPALEKLEAQKTAHVAKLDQAIHAVNDARNDRDRSLAKEALVQLQLELRSIESQITAEKSKLNSKYGTIGHGTGTGIGVGGSAPLTSPELEKLEKERLGLVKEIPALLAAVSDAKDDKARVAAKAKLDAKKTQIDGLDTKISAEKTRLSQRPRQGTGRPKGRGFVLA